MKRREILCKAAVAAPIAVAGVAGLTSPALAAGNIIPNGPNIPNPQSNGEVFFDTTGDALYVADTDSNGNLGFRPVGTSPVFAFSKTNGVQTLSNATDQIPTLYVDTRANEPETMPPVGMSHDGSARIVALTPGIYEAEIFFVLRGSPKKLDAYIAHERGGVLRHNHRVWLQEWAAPTNATVSTIAGRAYIDCIAGDVMFPRLTVEPSLTLDGDSRFRVFKV